MGVRGGLQSLQYIAVELPSALKCTVRELGGESNNLDEHCKSVHAGDSSVRVQDAKQLECEKWKAVCVVLSFVFSLCVLLEYYTMHVLTLPLYHKCLSSL